MVRRAATARGRPTKSGGQIAAPVEVSADLQSAWPVWRLWEAQRLLSSEFDIVSIDWIERANEVLDAVDDAHTKAKLAAQKKAGLD